MRALTKTTAVVGLTATVIALAGCGSGSNTAKAPPTILTSASDSNQPAVRVAGHGKVEGTPDTMTVTVGVETRDRSAQAALDQNNKEAAALIAALKAKGVAAKDIQTSNLSVSPTWDKDGNVNGYSVANTVTVQLHDLKNAGATIDAAAAGVGNDIRLQGVSFSIDDTSALVAKARAAAVQDATRQAHQLADAAGVKLGAIRTIDDTGTQLPQPQILATAGAQGRAAVPIEPGTQELGVDVTVVFDIAN